MIRNCPEDIRPAMREFVEQVRERDAHTAKLLGHSIVPGRVRVTRTRAPKGGGYAGTM